MEPAAASSATVAAAVETDTKKMIEADLVTNKQTNKLFHLLSFVTFDRSGPKKGHLSSANFCPRRT